MNPKNELRKVYCEISFTKFDLPESKNLFIEEIQSYYGITIDSSDLIYVYDQNQNKISIEGNFRSEHIAILPPIVKIVVEKSRVEKNMLLFRESLWLQPNKEESVLELQKEDNEFCDISNELKETKQKLNKLEEENNNLLKKLNVSTEKLLSSQFTEKKLMEEIENLNNKIITMNNDSLYTISRLKEEKSFLQRTYDDLVKSHSNKPNDTELIKKVALLQEKLMDLQEKQNENASLKEKLLKRFVEDVRSNTYSPVYSKESAYNILPDEDNSIYELYNDIVFQAKENFNINDFLDSNLGMLDAILNSTKYKKIKNVIPIDEKLLKSKELKDNIKAFTLFLQNILNIFDS